MYCLYVDITLTILRIWVGRSLEITDITSSTTENTMLTHKKPNWTCGTINTCIITTGMKNILKDNDVGDYKDKVIIVVFSCVAFNIFLLVTIAIT